MVWWLNDWQDIRIPKLIIFFSVCWLTDDKIIKGIWDLHLSTIEIFIFRNIFHDFSLSCKIIKTRGRNRDFMGIWLWHLDIIMNRNSQNWKQLYLVSVSRISHFYVLGNSFISLSLFSQKIWLFLLSPHDEGLHSIRP